MGLYITSTFSEVSLRQWVEVCKSLNLPKPEFQPETEDSWGEVFLITEDLFTAYRNYCINLMNRLEKDDQMSYKEHLFLKYWNIINNHLDYNTNGKFPIVFG